jgi:hypothetical protein
VQLLVDPELKDWLPEAPKLADEALERDILQRGVQDTIKVWKGHNLIVDGHRRFAVAQKHNLMYCIEELEFEDRNAVKRWMFEQQDLRRNWTAHDRHLVLSRLLALFKDSCAGDEEAAIKVAEVTGVSDRTVYRAQDYSERFQKFPAAVQEQLRTEKASQATVAELATLPEAHQLAVLESVKDGEFKTIREAVFGQKPQPAGGPPDNLSAQPGKRRKVGDDPFQEVEVRLGSLKKAVDALAEVHPGPDYKRMMDCLDRADDVLCRWKRESLGEEE